MSRNAALVVITLALFGCPSKDNQSSGGAATPTSGAPSTAAATGTGPLASLDAASAVSESWTPQDAAAAIPFLFFGPQNLRISASCKQPNGQLSCAAIQQLRGAPVDIPRRSLTGGISAGTHVCMKLNLQVVTGRNSVGAEDGFCKFGDGSMVSTGALEQYAMHVIQ